MIKREGYGFLLVFILFVIIFTTFNQISLTGNAIFSESEFVFVERILPEFVEGNDSEIILNITVDEGVSVNEFVLGEKVPGGFSVVDVSPLPDENPNDNSENIIGWLLDSISGNVILTYSVIPDVITEDFIGKYSYTFGDDSYEDSIVGDGEEGEVDLEVVENTGGGGGGGGGGSSADVSGWEDVHELTQEDLLIGTSRVIKPNQRIKMILKGEEHHVGVSEITGFGRVKLEIASEPQEAVIPVNQGKKFELTGDNYYDLLVEVKLIAGKNVKLAVKEINESIYGNEAPPEEEEEKEDVSIIEQLPPVETLVNKTSITVGVIAILLIVAFLFSKKKKERKNIIFKAKELKL